MNYFNFKTAFQEKPPSEIRQESISFRFLDKKIKKSRKLNKAKITFNYFTSIPLAIKMYMSVNMFGDS